MDANLEILNRVTVASPCSVSWESMKGDDRVRFCAQCSLNVYFLSGMTAQEAADLVRAKEGRICVRLYRRADGTTLTRDCPVGLLALRRRLAIATGLLISLLAACFGPRLRELPAVRAVVTWFQTPPTAWAPDSISSLGQARVIQGR